MPKRAKELSSLEVRRLRSGVHTVGGVAGLLIQVTTNGARSWLLRVRVGDRRREIGLGPFPEVSLARAREKASETKDAIRNGIDPVEARKAAKSALLAAQRKGLTFTEAFEKYAEKKLPELRTDRYRSQWRATVENTLFQNLAICWCKTSLATIYCVFCIRFGKFGLKQRRKSDNASKRHWTMQRRQVIGQETIPQLGVATLNWPSPRPARLHQKRITQRCKLKKLQGGGPIFLAERVWAQRR